MPTTYKKEKNKCTYSEIATDPKRSFRFLFYLSGQTEGRQATLRPYTVKQVKSQPFNWKVVHSKIYSAHV